MDERFHKKMMIRIRFFNPKWGEPKYSIRVVPQQTEVLNRGGTGVFCASGADEGWSSCLEAVRSSGFELSSLGFELNPRGLHL